MTHPFLVLITTGCIQSNVRITGDEKRGGRLPLPSGSLNVPQGAIPPSQGQDWQGDKHTQKITLLCCIQLNLKKVHTLISQEKINKIIKL